MSVATYTPKEQAKSIGFGNIMLSEWTKLRSVRSTYWTLVFAVLASLAITGLTCYHTARDIKGNSGDIANMVGDPTNTTLVGLYLGEVAFGVLGVLVVSSEYGTGMIRAALTAVPQRRIFLAAKGLVLALTILVIGEALSITSFLLGRAFLNTAGVNLQISDPGVLRAVLGGGLYLMVIALIGYGFGALIRRTAGGLSVFFLVLFALDPLTNLLPTDWRNHVINYLPLNAGSQILVTQPNTGALSPWTGLAVLSLYAVVPIVLAGFLIKRRDA
jgi:ABC-type transport system involved in multi-copper enzyme maturation permease subunit